MTVSISLYFVIESFKPKVCKKSLELKQVKNQSKLNVNQQESSILIFGLTFCELTWQGKRLLNKALLKKNCKLIVLFSVS